jgi:hypothetical protein
VRFADGLEGQPISFHTVTSCIFLNLWTRPTVWILPFGDHESDWLLSQHVKILMARRAVGSGKSVHLFCEPEQVLTSRIPSFLLTGL